MSMVLPGAVVENQLMEVIRDVVIKDDEVNAIIEITRRSNRSA